MDWNTVARVQAELQKLPAIEQKVNAVQKSAVLKGNREEQGLHGETGPKADKSDKGNLGDKEDKGDKGD